MFGQTVIATSCGFVLYADRATDEAFPVPHRDWGAESADETRGVGTIWSVRRRCRGVSRLVSTLGWSVRGVFQPLRWWLSGDTDAMWLDRCVEDADRPFFHGLAERLRSGNVPNVQWIPVQLEGFNEGTEAD